MAPNLSKQLEDAVHEISKIPLDKIAEKGAGAFNKFKIAVNQAVSGRQGSPDDILGAVDCKGLVLTFLVDLFEKKSMLRKQLVAVAVHVLSVASWTTALRGDIALCARMPEEYKMILEESVADTSDAWEDAKRAAAQRETKTEEECNLGQAKKAMAEAAGAADAARATEATRAATAAWQPYAAEPLPVPWPKPHAQHRVEDVAVGDADLVVGWIQGQQAETPPHPSTAPPTDDSTGCQPPSGTEIIKAARQAWRNVNSSAEHAGATPSAAGHSDASLALEFIDEGLKEMRRLGFRATSLDDALTAFENFRKGVHKAVRMGQTNYLERLDQKELILRFLGDVHERKKTARPRIAALLTQLADFDGWHHASSQDALTQDLLRDFPLEPSPAILPQPDPRATTFVVGQKLEYLSTSANRWIPCNVISVSAMGEVRVDCKPDTSFSLTQQKTCLRLSAGGTVPTPAPVQPPASHEAGKRTSPPGHFTIGENVEYLSTSANRWIAAKVTHAKTTGEVQLDCKPGHWFQVAEQRQKVRARQ